MASPIEEEDSLLSPDERSLHGREERRGEVGGRGLRGWRRRGPALGGLPARPGGGGGRRARAGANPEIRHSDGREGAAVHAVREKEERGRARHAFA
jgi:hypothetical protein